MVSFDSILNAIIPYIVAILGIWLFIHVLREPLGALWNGVKSVFGKFRGREDDSAPAGGVYIHYE